MRKLYLACVFSMALPTVVNAQAVPKSAAVPKLAQPKPVATPKVERGLAIRPSKLSVAQTIDAIAKAAEEKGARIVARVDHAAGAKVVGADLKPVQVLIFGNPKLGTPLMQSNIRSGLDLPLKVLAYEDAKGNVWVVTNSARGLGSRYKIDGKAGAGSIKAIAAAMDAILTSANFAK